MSITALDGGYTSYILVSFEIQSHYVRTRPQNSRNVFSCPRYSSAHPVCCDFVYPVIRWLNLYYYNYFSFRAADWSQTVQIIWECEHSDLLYSAIRPGDTPTKSANEPADKNKRGHFSQRVKTKHTNYNWSESRITHKTGNSSQTSFKLKFSGFSCFSLWYDCTLINDNENNH